MSEYVNQRRRCLALQQRNTYLNNANSLLRQRLHEQRPKEQPTLETLLAEACELGSHDLNYVGRKWQAVIYTGDLRRPTSDWVSTPAEALSAAITKARASSKNGA